MVQAIVIIAWRNDVGAYLLDSMPSGVEIDGQDLMNLYNLHRFRDTKANFQFISTSDKRIASFYSGGYDNPYVGKPNYAIAIVLEKNENPDNFEKPLRILTNNILLHLDDEDFDEYFASIFEIIQMGNIDEIKIERKQISGGPSPQNIETTETYNNNGQSNEEKDIFDDLLASVSDEEVPDDLKFDEDAFRQSLKSESSANNPFGPGTNGSTANNPFSGNGGKSEDLFSTGSGDPFSSFETGNKMAQLSSTPKIQTSQIMQDLKSIDAKMPKEPTDKAPEKLISYLEQKVGFLEKKMSILSQLANQLQQKERELNEKNELISKLLILLS